LAIPKARSGSNTWVIDSERVMIYNSNKTGDDEFNFELYYFVDKKHK